MANRKTTSMSFDERIQKLGEVSRGWLNYFRMAGIQVKLKEVDGWFRNRLRYCTWHHWRTDCKEFVRWTNLRRGQVAGEGTEKENLIRLGVEQGQAYAWSRSRMGGWAIAQSPILGTTITIDRLKKRGYVRLLELYNQIKPNTV